MIEKHLTLSCYTLQHPFSADYSHFDEEIVDLIDKNNDIYEFSLADTMLYEVDAPKLRRLMAGDSSNSSKEQAR